MNFLGKQKIAIFYCFQNVKDNSLENTLDSLSKNEYTWEELQQRPLPDGVDPSKLEKYLSEEDFEVC